MITEDALRELMADADLPTSMSPELVRGRARTLRRHRRAGLAGGVALVLPALVIGLTRVPYWQGKSAGVARSVAFAGDGSPLPVQGGGKVALNIPHLYAYTGPSDLCWGSDARDGVGGMCMVDGADDVSNGGMSLGDGVIGSISVVPVVRAEFVVDAKVIPAQVVGFAKYPQWRTLTAPIAPADELAATVVIHGWDASGAQVLDVCTGEACPAQPQTTQPVLPPNPADAHVPAAAPAVPIGGPVAVLPDMRVGSSPASRRGRRRTGSASAGRAGPSA